MIPPLAITGQKETWLSADFDPNRRGLESGQKIWPSVARQLASDSRPQKECKAFSLRTTVVYCRDAILCVSEFARCFSTLGLILQRDAKFCVSTACVGRALIYLCSQKFVGEFYISNNQKKPIQTLKNAKPAQKES